MLISPANPVGVRVLPFLEGQVTAHEPQTLGGQCGGFWGSMMLQPHTISLGTGGPGRFALLLRGEIAKHREQKDECLRWDEKDAEQTL